MAQADSNNTTTHSRRAVLGVAGTLMAGIAVSGSAVASKALAAADPIFALIDAHRQSYAVHLAAIKEADRLQRNGERDSSRILEKPCDDENAAFDTLVGCAATTFPGIFAKLKYLRGLAEHEGWMFDERVGTALALIESFAVSLSALEISQ